MYPVKWGGGGGGGGGGGSMKETREPMRSYGENVFGIEGFQYSYIPKTIMEW